MLCALLSLVHAALPVYAADAILLNSDMEQGGKSTAVAWSTDVRSGSYEFLIADQAHSGSRCLAIRCTGETGWGRWYTTDVFLLQGATYRLTAWARSEGEGVLGIIWMPAEPTLASLEFTTVPEWKLFTAEFTAPRTGRFGLYLQSGGRGTVFYDDVAIELVKPAPPTAGGLVPTDGAPLSRIVVPDETAPHHGYLAAEVQRVLQAMTGGSLAITSASAVPPEGRAVYIGLAPGGTDYRRDLRALADEGIILDITPQAVVCLGKTPRGVYYAVQELFYVLGCRWYLPEGPGECLPRVERLSLAAQKVVHNPSFALRGSKTIQAYHYPPEMKVEHVPIEPWVDWAARNRMNGLKAGYPWSWEYGAIRGGQWSEWSGHTLYTILPPEKWFATHPEYYPLVRGKRTATHSSGRPAQVCVSDPDLPRIIADFIIEYFDGNPQAKRFGVCAEDEPSYWCECEACKALDTEPVDWSKSGEGSLPLTDRWLYLVNQVADIVAERYPDRYVHTFAYASSRFPPKREQPHKNVMVELTWWDRCLKHRVLDPKCEVNARGMKLLNGWRKLAPLSIYGYLDYHYMEDPCPFFHAEADFLRTVHRRGVRHISDEWDTTFTASPLLLNLRARLLWDLDTDVDAYIADFCARVYGPAAEEVQAYYSALEDGVREAKTEHVGFNELARFPPEVLAAASGHLDQAFEQAGEDETLQARLARLRLGLLFTELCILQQDLEKDVSLYARTEPLKQQLHDLVQRYRIPVIIGAYDRFSASYRPPVEVLQAERLAELPEQWLFRTDPGNVGEQEGWPTGPTTDWKPISTHSAWEGQSHEGYDGYGWYAVDTVLPAAPGKRVWLLFNAVDETFRLWINGAHVGDSEGEPGVLWDKPVAVEITDQYRPGETNHLVLRVHDSAYAGGIWKAVEVRGK